MRMKKLIAIFLCMTSLSFAEDKDVQILKDLKRKGVQLEYVYHPEWIVLYSFDNKNRITKVNNPHKWKVPHHNCILEPVQNSIPKKFSRRVTCNGKDLGLIECVAKGTKTRCEKLFGKISVVLKIKKYPTMGTRRAIEAEHERENKNPY